MLVYKNNYREIFPLFKESLNLCNFISFDCEMTGVMYDLKTDGTKYDTQLFRYYKCREIVKKFDLFQIGITFYIPKQKVINIEKEIKDEVEKKNEIEIQVKTTTTKFYLERTFTFSLFKNSKLRLLGDLYSHDGLFSIFSSFTTCHPAALKFLNENHFDLNNIVNHGIHYNKLSYSSKIKQALEKHIIEGKLPNSVVYLSKVNQTKLIVIIKTIIKFLIFGKDDNNEDKQSKKNDKILKIPKLNTFLINYLLSINMKKFIKISNFNLMKDKSDLDTLIIEKSKVNLNVDEFKNFFGTYEKFCEELTIDMIFKAKYSQFVFDRKELESILDEELGFSKFIQAMIDSNSYEPKPIIGHNLFFDLLFIYDKFIDDLPDNFYEYKEKIHKYFPIIFDNKFLTTRLAKEINNTKLDLLYKYFKTNKLDIFIDIKPDVLNGFSYYSDPDSNLLHDAGFDSLITGRCFIYLLKAVENNFEIENKKGSVLKIGKEVIKNLKVDLIDGYVDLKMKNDILAEFINKTVLSLLEEPHDVINFDTSNESEEEFIKKESFMINELFKNVYIAIMKSNQNSTFTIYEIARYFENPSFNYSIIKIHDHVAFIEFLPIPQNYESEEQMRLVLKEIIDKLCNENTDYVEQVIDYLEFSKLIYEIIKV